MFVEKEMEVINKDYDVPGYKEKLFNREIC